jgi:hypothetical protein
VTKLRLAYAAFPGQVRKNNRTLGGTQNDDYIIAFIIPVSQPQKLQCAAGGNNKRSGSFGKCFYIFIFDKKPALGATVKRISNTALEVIIDFPTIQLRRQLLMNRTNVSMFGHNGLSRFG